MPDGVAVITGGGRGIGASIARSLAADGWSVVVSARSRDQIDEVAAETGGRAVTNGDDMMFLVKAVADGKLVTTLNAGD